MTISYNWLKQYIDTNLTPQEMSVIFTNLGLEVESLEAHQSVKGGLEGFVIAEVVTCERHPNADKLSKTTINIGGDRLLNVVCGAPNCRAGLKTVLATIGTKIHAGDEVFEIKKSKIRGEESEGMLCSEVETNLGTDASGILELPTDAVPGTLAKDYYKIENDWVFEIGLTPNRIDSGSHYGVARDLAAYLSQQGAVKLQKPSVDEFKTEGTVAPITVKVENSEACPRYSGISICGVKIDESPAWLKNRLKAIGLNPINNVVDITNFILHELGQPLHAFDAAKIKGKQVVVRTLNEGAKFTTLDAVERNMSANDLMICNESEGMCIAGVFGGLDSGITGYTTDVFIESAYFNPVWVRKTARRHGLSTDSSFRFERGIDPNGTVYALKRAAMLIQQIAGGVITGPIIDLYPNPIEDFKVDINYQRVNNLIGKEIGVETIKKILAGLEITIVAETAEGLSLRVPPYRVDVCREADIVEELLRVYGFNNVEISEKVSSTLSYVEKPDRHYLQNLVSEYLTSNGFNEMMANSLTKSEYYESDETRAKQLVRIMNPLSIDLNCMRQTLLFGTLEAIALNSNYRNPNLRFYEFGNVYFFDKKTDETNTLKNYRENKNLSIAVTGLRSEGNWAQKAEPVSFYYLKAFVNAVLKRLGVNPELVQVSETSLEYLSDGLCYTLNNKTIVDFGVVARKYLKAFDIKNEVYFAEINWDNLIALIRKHTVKVAELPKYPEVERDLSMLLNSDVKFAQLCDIARKTEKKLLRDISLFDVYQGDKIEAGKKSYAVRFVLRDDSQTLTDKQIDKVMDSIWKNIEKETGAQLR